MSYDAKKLTYQEVTILGKPALFAECRLDRTTVPEGVYRYELRHADEDWGEPITLSRSILVNYYGTVLTREPFQLPVEGWIPLASDSLSFQDGGCRTLAEFQQKYPISEKNVIDFYSVNDETLHDLYFSRGEEQDKAVGCVGHLRGDFGSGGKQFFTTWWLHQNDALNTPAFKADIDRAVNWLREQPDSPLRDFDTMKRCCERYGRSCAIKGTLLPSCAFMAKTKQYVYMIRCTPVKGDYHFYCYVGIAADEPKRIKNEQYPLVDWDITEAEALKICYDRGYDWGGLYEIYHRCSCWCCPLQRIGELRKLRHHHPELWQKLREMDQRAIEQFGHNPLGQFKKDWTVERLEQRFAAEDAQISVFVRGKGGRNEKETDSA